MPKTWDRYLHQLLLKGQAPPAQEELGEQLPEEQGRAECSWTLALKEENCFSSFFPPHFGHAPGLSALERINCSNTAEQLPHLYSYRGIIHLVAIPASVHRNTRRPQASTPPSEEFSPSGTSA